MTTSALFDLYTDAFQSLGETCEKNCENIDKADSGLNSVCKEQKEGEVAAKHNNVLEAMEAEGLECKLQEFDVKMEKCHPTFKFFRDYMKFVGCILMFIHATRLHDCKMNL